MTGPQSKARFEEAQRLAHAGVCQTDAAVILAMSKARLWEFAKRHGIELLSAVVAAAMLPGLIERVTQEWRW